MVDESSQFRLGDVKLGKLPARHDARTFQLSTYTKKAVPPPPALEDWASKVRSWPMLENNRVGDCTCACAGHMIQQWTTYAGRRFVPKDDQIIRAYSAITNYDPVTGQHDDGAVVLDVLNYWRKNGIAGRQIRAYAAVDWKNHIEIQDAVFLFGNCYLGIALPQTAARQVMWAVPPGGMVGPGAPGSWGGHAVPVVSYGPRGLTVVTWGALKRMSWGFLDAYCDEAYAVLSRDWIYKVQNISASGFALRELEADLQQIAGPVAVSA